MNLNYEKARVVMVKNQLRPNKIKEERILKLFKSTPKEIFVEEDQKKFCYSDQDLSISTGRGYLKNLHLAQIMRSAEINKNDKILHIGGLTGYLSIMMAKICDNIFVIENDEKNINKLNQNILEYNLRNINVINDSFENGYVKENPYDLIVIDCPLYYLNNNLIGQLRSNGGRLIYIKKINIELSKAYKVIKQGKNYSNQYLFDVFSNFVIDKKLKEFNF